MALMLEFLGSIPSVQLHFGEVPFWNNIQGLQIKPSVKMCDYYTAYVKHVKIAVIAPDL